MMLNDIKILIGDDSILARKQLKDVGFQYVYTLYDGEFKKDYL